MAWAAKYWIPLVILVLLGLYLVIWHVDLPLSHEAVGLGDNHLAHSVVGIVLLVGAVWVGWRGWKATRAT